MHIHLIAIGGAVMHNLAMALHNKGIRVSGSDDEIFEPSRSRLESYGLLPEQFGWHPEKITKELDGIILGMHAREDNPELLKARELGLKVWSFPEYIYENSKHKKRVVIGGSHGKTTVTSMIMHVLWYNHYDFDYMVGSQLEGFETMVKLSSDAPVIILEGDEYLSSPIDRRPKFHLYQPHIAVLTGIEWDHMNVFPTFENYLDQFGIFAKAIPAEGSLFWYLADENLQNITRKCSCKSIGYQEHSYRIKEGKSYLLRGEYELPIPVFGKHNMQNIQAALHVCLELGLTEDEFYEAIGSFKGAAKRQELLADAKNKKVFLDFAHAPSKVRATVNSFKETYPDDKLIAVLELHTFSSLNKNFLPMYEGSMNKADLAAVFYNPEVVSHKKLSPLNPQFVKECFQQEELIVLDSKEKLQDFLASLDLEGVYLFMSSGNFSGLNMAELAKEIVSR